MVPDRNAGVVAVRSLRLSKFISRQPLPIAAVFKRDFAVNATAWSDWEIHAGFDFPNEEELSVLVRHQF